MGTAVKEREVRVSGNGHQEAHDEPVFAFAKTLGNAHRKSLTDSEPLHKEWLKASDPDKRVMRLEFMVGFVTGALQVARDTAETVINGRVRAGATPTPTKPARTADQQKAYDSARKMFSFHISRNDIKIRTREEVRQIRLSTAFKQAAEQFVTTFYEEMNAAAVEEVIRQLQVLKKRLQAA